ncbi:small gtp-binding protein [Candidatus Magnetomorum sp. HK-1]|nr:small gtp-binding protein [Candidatus Magnetomorum sp. HK-1]
MPKRSPQIFISYAQEDRKIAERIYSDLSREGFAVWIDFESLVPGQTWKYEIEKAIRSCEYFLVLLSRNSITKRGFVQKEIRVAMNILDEYPVDDIFIIPARIDNVSTSENRLNELNSVDLFPDYNAGLSKIIRALKIFHDADDSSASDVVIQEIGKGKGAISIGDGSVAAGRDGIAVSGNVSGTIIMGDGNRVVSFTKEKSKLSVLLDNQDETETLILTTKDIVSDIPSELDRLKHVNHLIIKDIDLKDNELPDEIGLLNELISIDFRNNNLTRLPPTFNKLKNIKEINIANNNFHDFPSCIFNFFELRKIDISNNFLIEIPDGIKNQKQLIRFAANSNRISNLSSGLCELLNLEILQLNNNLLSALPVELNKLKNLTHLELRRNKFNEFPKPIGLLPNLRELDLEGNEINDIPEIIGELIKLKKLDLSNNQVSKLPMVLNRLLSLESLIFNNNNFKCIQDEICQIVNLKNLSFNNNKIETISFKLNQLSNIETLYLSHNCIKAIPASISKLNKLRILELDYNEISYFPNDMQNMQNLEKLVLNDNLLPIPQTIIREYSSPQEIIKYYFNSSKTTLNEAKVLIVGQPSVGKTSLIKRLLKGYYNKDEKTTLGVDIQTSSMKINGLDIKLNFWDFGGQEIMHATHQFFLTKRSIYILVLDSRLDEENNRLYYWLQLIKSYGGNNVPILIICNKCDERQLELDWKSINDDYPNSCFVKKVSCETGEGIEEVRENVKKLTEGLVHLNDPIPITWLSVKNHLESIKKEKDFISFKEFQTICNDVSIKEDSTQRTLIAFMHDLGVVLHYSGIRAVEDTNVLNPEWVTKGIYKILTSHILFNKYGMLNIEDLDLILDMSIYPRDKQGYLIEMMKLFELCFEVPIDNGRQLLIPDLLRKETPFTGNWGDALLLKYDYKILPGSIISRFIVRMHEHIKDDTYWRFGVVLEFSDHNSKNNALIRADIENNHILICVSGSQRTRRESLRLIREAFDRINESIPKLQVDIKVPIPEKPEVTVRYEHLLMLEEKGESTHWPDGLDFSVEVRELLNGIISEERRVEYREAIKYSKKEKENSAKKEVIMNNPIRILHLSDLHVKADTDINSLIQPLFADIEDQIDGLGIDKINYLVVTGDFTNCASIEEFQKAEQLCKSIKKQYGISSEKMLLVPGNHDLDWDEDVYELILKRKIDISNLESGKFIEDGKSVFIRLVEKYPDRFKNFSNELYRILTSETYPLGFEDQCIPFYFHDHKIQFLLINSSWEIDEHFPNRSGIHQGAVSKGLLSASKQIKEAIQQGRLNNENEVLRIACWHHPATGNEKIVTDAFMENIQKGDFKICLHGHVHEERADLFGYFHPSRKIHIIGAGSFDAPSKDRPESIPRIYNLIEIYRENNIIRVHTRCKMRDTGAWAAWAVWPSKQQKHSRSSYYDIQIQEA